MSGRVSADNGIRASAASEAKRRRGREFTPSHSHPPVFPRGAAIGDRTRLVRRQGRQEPLLKTIRFLTVGALLALACSAGASDAVFESNVTVLLEHAEFERFGFGLKQVNNLLVIYPGNARLLQFQRQFAEGLARVAPPSGSTLAPPSVARSGGKPPALASGPAEPGRNFTCETAGIPLVWIAGGSFWMSSTHGSDDGTLATLSRGYWLGQTEVTQEEWQVLMEHIPAPSLFKGSDRPVERVSWVSAMEFCRKLNERERAGGRLPTGYEYTLPTEAQWEFACRAGTTTSFAGDVEAMAWHWANGGRQTHSVAQKQPNAWGLYDMHGNVYEWCADGYGGYVGGRAIDPRGDPQSPSSGTFRIARGGSWTTSVGMCRAGNRYWYSLNYSGPGVGFRLALAPEAGPVAGAKPGRGVSENK